MLSITDQPVSAIEFRDHPHSPEIMTEILSASRIWGITLSDKPDRQTLNGFVQVVFLMPNLVDDPITVFIRPANVLKTIQQLATLR